MARKEVVLPKGMTFIKQGDEIKNFKYLKEGLIKLHKIDAETGKEQIISFGKPMDFVSIHNIFAETTYSYSVTTLEKSTVCVFKLDVIEKLVATNGEFARRIIETRCN